VGQNEGVSDLSDISQRRLAACHELLTSAGDWLGPVETPQDRPWLEQRQIELIVRSLQTMQGVVMLADHRLWVPTYGLARMLLEDAAVSYWLVDHPDVDALRRRWTEHLDATRFGDLRTQEELGLEVDAEARAWHQDQDPDYLEQVAQRHRSGSNHWTGKALAELVAGAAGRGGSTREDWDARTAMLHSLCKRMNLAVSLALHHSPAGSQNWYAVPGELLGDSLKVAWLAFGLHLMLVLEDFAPQHWAALDELLARQRDDFTAE
jgi:hypothetical protein